MAKNIKNLVFDNHFIKTAANPKNGLKKLFIANKEIVINIPAFLADPNNGIDEIYVGGDKLITDLPNYFSDPNNNLDELYINESQVLNNSDSVKLINSDIIIIIDHVGAPINISCDGDCTWTEDGINEEDLNSGTNIIITTKSTVIYLNFEKSDKPTYLNFNATSGFARHSMHGCIINNFHTINNIGSFYKANQSLMYSVINANTNNINDTNNMYQFCYDLNYASWFDTSNVTNFAYMHTNNYSIKYIPQYDFTSSLNMDAIFENCRSLLKYGDIICPLLGFNSKYGFNRLFNGAYEIKTIGYIAAGNNIWFDSVFNECRELEYIKGIDVSCHRSNRAFKNAHSLISFSGNFRCAGNIPSDSFSGTNSLVSPTAAEVTTILAHGQFSSSAFSGTTNYEIKLPNKSVVDNHGKALVFNHFKKVLTWTPMAFPTTGGTAGQVLRLAADNKTLEWYTLP